MGLPFIGETLALIFDPKFAEKRFKQYGPIFKTRFLGRPLVFLVGAEAAELVLSTQFESFSWAAGWPATFRLLLGESLFLQEGDEHRRNRKLIMPAFHGPALAQYWQTMDSLTQEYLNRWEALEEFAAYPEFKQLTFAIASQLFLGSSSPAETTRLSHLFTQLTNGLFGLGLPRAIAARNQLLDHLTQVIEARQQHPTDTPDALNLLLQTRDEEGNGLTVAEIRAQAMLLLFAGHETTTAMLTWAMVELAHHPDVLARARQEQSLVPLTLASVNQMPYLDQILSEIERLHPPVAGGFRGVVKPFSFQGYDVPAGWMAQYSILLTHYDPRVYTDPDRFDPDRFSPARQEAKQKPFSLIGFGGGARICIGLAFAKLEMKLVLAQLLRQYRWELLPNQRLDPVIVPTRRPRDNARVRFEPLAKVL
jgi:retinoid hydroxylase